LNSFYKVYYRLFDICEHALVSALLLATILVLFLPLMFISLHDSLRPLFTIAVLVTGVVGGLIVVITVVYFYKFCLKKRPALSTTGKPEWKRDVIRSTMNSQCRPLPLPAVPLIGLPGLGIHHAMHLATKEVATETDLVFRAVNPTEMGDLESAPGNAKVAHVFPLQPRISNGSESTVVRVSGEKVFLAVQPPSRTHSVEAIGGGSHEEELRRASFDAPRNTGRQLPSLEHLEMAAEMTKERQEAEMRDRVNRLGDGRVRRMSTFNRSNAIFECPPSPVKQISSPLPEHTNPRMLYERDHEHARSWNPGVYELDDNGCDITYGRERITHKPTSLGPYYQRDYGIQPPQQATSLKVSPTTRISPAVPGVQQDHFSIPVVINEPPPTSNSKQHNSRDSNNLSVRVQRQAKSFDERRGSSHMPLSVDRRTTSETDEQRRRLMRQATIRMLEPENPVSAECQTLWDHRGHLEQLSALGISDPSSTSTSFESYSESGIGAPPSVVSTRPKENIDANTKRNKYKSLLTERKFLSTVTNPAAPSSFESTASSSSYAGGPSSDANFASSVDSAELERRRLSLMSCNDGTRATNIPAIATSSRRPVAEIPPFHRNSNQRDYAVDAHTDHVFREFSRIDPAYPSPTFSSRPVSRRQTVDQDEGLPELPRRFPSYAQQNRQYSMSGTGGTPMIPLIRYPEDQPGISQGSSGLR
ncbi:hypothetical protein PMAYCL1PPCAC_04465, partial [Pristionchus mayeri]